MIPCLSQAPMGLFFRRKDGIFRARRFRMKSRYFFLNFAFCMALGTHAQLPEAHWSAQSGVTSSISGKVLTWGSVGLQSPVASSSSNFAGPFVDSSLSGISNRAAIRFGLGSGSLEPLYFPDIVVDTPTIILIANVPSFNHSMHYALSAMQGHLNMGKREYADTLAPGSILHTPLEAGLSSSSPPTYCCASVPRALSTLESGTTLEVSIPETCISLIGDPAIGSIVPNPASEKTTLYLLNAKDLPFNLTIVDMKGREVFHQNALANEAVYPIALVVSDWAAGTYKIVFSVGSIALTASLVVE